MRLEIGSAMFMSIEGHEQYLLSGWNGVTLVGIVVGERREGREKWSHSHGRLETKLALFVSLDGKNYLSGGVRWNNVALVGIGRKPLVGEVLGGFYESRVLL